MRQKTVAAPLEVPVVVLGGLGPASTQTLNGAGAALAYPLYSKWFDVYPKVTSPVRFNYQSIGSGGGRQQLFNPSWISEPAMLR
jgi:ABC-type phosphate transport system substrate-binding protein